MKRGAWQTLTLVLRWPWFWTLRQGWFISLNGILPWSAPYRANQDGDLRHNFISKRGWYRVETQFHLLSSQPPCLPLCPSPLLPFSLSLFSSLPPFLSFTLLLSLPLSHPLSFPLSASPLSASPLQPCITFVLLHLCFSLSESDQSVSLSLSQSPFLSLFLFPCALIFLVVCGSFSVHFSVWHGPDPLLSLCLYPCSQSICGSLFCVCPVFTPCL